jgi:hypothetical protein
MMVVPGVFWSLLCGIVLGFWGCVVVKTQLPESMTSGSRGNNKNSMVLAQKLP